MRRLVAGDGGGQGFDLAGEEGEIGFVLNAVFLERGLLAVHVHRVAVQAHVVAGLVGDEIRSGRGDVARELPGVLGLERQAAGLLPG